MVWKGTPSSKMKTSLKPNLFLVPGDSVLPGCTVVKLTCFKTRTIKLLIGYTLAISLTQGYLIAAFCKWNTLRYLQ